MSPRSMLPVIIEQVAQAQSTTIGNEKFVRTIGVCQLIDNKPESRLLAYNSFSPLGSSSVYMRTVERKELGWSGKVTVLQQPTYGEVEGDDSGNFGYFLTTPGFVGIDHATFLVEIGGYKIKVFYYFKVMQSIPVGTDGYDPYLDKKYCPKGTHWKTGA